MRPRAFLASSVTHRRGTLGLRVLGVVGAAVTFAGTVVTSAGAGALVFALGLGIVSLTLLLAAVPARKWARAQLRVEGDALVVGGDEDTLELLLRDLSMGWAEGPNATLVDGSGGRLESQFDSAETAEAFIEALELDAPRRRLVLPLRGQVGKATWTFLGGFVGLFLGGFVVPITGARPAVVPAMLLAMAASAWAFRRLGDRRVTIGADGVRVRGIRSRFVGYGEIEAVDRGAPPFVTTTVRLALRDGTFVDLPVVGQTEAAIDALVRRIEVGMHAERAPGLELPELARAGRELSHWQRDLADLARPTADFRTQRVDPEDLERIVLDPRASGERRVGAALALMPTDPALARRRARAAASAAADERVRVALEKVADDALDEDDLALLELADEEREALAARAEEPEPRARRDGG